MDAMSMCGKSISSEKKGCKKSWHLVMEINVKICLWCLLDWEDRYWFQALRSRLRLCLTEFSSFAILGVVCNISQSTARFCWFCFIATCPNILEGFSLESSFFTLKCFFPSDFCVSDLTKGGSDRRFWARKGACYRVLVESWGEVRHVLFQTLEAEHESHNGDFEKSWPLVVPRGEKSASVQRFGSYRGITE